MLRNRTTETEFFRHNSVSLRVPLVPMESESRSFGTRILNESGLALSFYMNLRFQMNGHTYTNAKTRVGAPELRANFIGAIAT